MTDKEKAELRLLCIEKTMEYHQTKLITKDVLIESKKLFELITIGFPVT